MEQTSNGYHNGAATMTGRLAEVAARIQQVEPQFFFNKGDRERQSL